MQGWIPSRAAAAVVWVITHPGPSAIPGRELSLRLSFYFSNQRRPVRQERFINHLSRISAGNKNKHVGTGNSIPWTRSDVVIYHGGGILELCDFLTALTQLC